MGNEDTFLAALLCKSSIPNQPPYEISLTATPKVVNIAINDTAPLNFDRQPIGNVEVFCGVWCVDYACVCR